MEAETAAMVKMAVRNRLLLLLTALALFCGCSKPVGNHRFVSVQTARLEGGRFEFNADFDDTTESYATAIAARAVTRVRSAERQRGSLDSS